MAFNQSVVLAGLSSYSVTMPASGAYFIEGKIQLPSIKDGGGQSGVVATISNTTTSTTLQTTVAGSDGFYLDFNAAANDVIQVALTSAAAADQPLNTIKTTIQVGSGQ